MVDSHLVEKGASAKWLLEKQKRIQNIQNILDIARWKLSC